MNRKPQGYDDDPDGFLPIIPQDIQAYQSRTDRVDAGGGPPSMNIQQLGDSFDADVSNVFGFDGDVDPRRERGDYAAGGDLNLVNSKQKAGDDPGDQYNQLETARWGNLRGGFDGGGKHIGFDQLEPDPITTHQQQFGGAVRGRTIPDASRSSLSSSSSNSARGFSSSSAPDVRRYSSPSVGDASLRRAAVAVAVQEQSLEGQFVTPNDFDILSGRGRRIQTNLGNVLLHQVVDLHRGRYNSAPRSERRDIAETIVRALNGNGNRFLSRVVGTGLLPEGWQVITHDEAVEKVAHCFRSRRRI